MNNIDNWVNQWAIEDGDQSYREINLQTNFFAKELYHDYEPVQGQASTFRNRLENWISNADDDADRKVLFKSLKHIFYIGTKEINSLYRVAYDELIASWLIDVENISLTDFDQAKREVDNAIRECWICPVTESMLINPFFHVNNIPNNGWNGQRPDWNGIGRAKQSSMHKWQSHLHYIQENNIDKLILLEDFVGSGSQIGNTVRFLLQQGLDLDVLLLPLITCPIGVKVFKNMETNFDRLTFKSVLKPSVNCFVTKNSQPNEPDEFEEIRELIQRNYLDVSGGRRPGRGKPYSPFGYRGTGGLIVKYSNTPDNTLPVIHWKSDSWNPIFPRHSRD